MDLNGNQLKGFAGAVQFGDGNAIALADANYTLLATDYNKPVLRFTGALTADRNMTLPLTADALWFVRNATSGGHGLVMKGATGATVTVANGKFAIIYCDGVDILRVTADV
jgi:hypothetical protein